MTLRDAFLATVCAALLATSGASAADGYRPDEFFGLNLSNAVLSPKPLGPTTTFAPVAVEAKGDRNSEVSWARNALKTEPRKVAVRHVRAARVHTAAHVRSEKPRAAAPTRLARRHTNPLDAQAFDTRIQVWPCRSGGICNWKRPAEPR
jgi:hypothetical protein